MTRIEDLLRAATRETAAEVRPESIPPLDPATLPVPRRSLLRFGGPLSPLLAAAAVVLVVAASVTLSTVLHASQPPASSSDTDIAGVPPYYVALTSTGTPAANHPVDLTVRSTLTGKVLTTVAAPRPYGTFNLVDGTADDRTFLVGAQVWHPSHFGTPDNIPEPVRLFWLRYDPSTGQARFTALPIPQFNGLELQTASVSPDGTRLAVGYQDMNGNTSIRTYTLPGGAQRIWSPTPAQEGNIGLDRDNPATIAWAANDRTISFVWGPPTEGGVHLLDTGVKGTNDLLSASRFVLPLTGTGSGSSNFLCDSDPFLSANGAYVLCGGYTVPKGTVPPAIPKGPVTRGFGEFSATTGRLITILGAHYGPLPTIRVKAPFPGLQTQTGINGSALPYLLWASSDARILIGEVNGRGVVVRDGHEQTIPWSSRIAVPEGSNIPAAAW